MTSPTISDRFSFVALGLVLALSDALFLMQVLPFVN